MKVLFIDGRAGGDWGMDLLYSGLVRNLGAENVVDFPAQKKHRMGKPKLIGDPEKDWGAERMSLSYVPEWEKIPSFNRELIRSMLSRFEFDYVFVDERRESAELYFELQLNWRSVPVVVVAGHDRFWNTDPEYVKQAYYKKNLHRMYLDNWKKEYEFLSYARKYSWAANFDHLWDASTREDLLRDKLYDISFMGYNSHPSRKRYIDYIRRRWSHLKLNLVLEERPNCFDMFVLKSEYFKTIAQSRIALNLRGAAENGKAMRFYEIPYVGSYMLSEHFPGKEQAGLSSYNTFSNEHVLDIHIQGALGIPEEREMMARNCHLELLSRHTVYERVRQMLEDIRG